MSGNPVYVCSGPEHGADACCRATAVLLEDESNQQPGRLSMRKLKIFSGLPHASQIYLSPRIIKTAVCSALRLDFLKTPSVGRGLGSSLVVSLHHSSSSLHPFLSLPPTVALCQQLEPVSGKTLLVVHALWDEVATTSITPDSGVAGRRHCSWNPTG